MSVVTPIDDNPDHAAREQDARAFRRALLISGGFVSLLWWIKLLETWLDRPLTALGVRPWEVHGLVGILCAPLIHGSIAHLLANTLPLLVLGTLAFWVYPRASLRGMPLIWILSGAGVWLIGRPSWHFGASGLDHGLMFFLFVLGVARRDKRSIATALVTFFLYGGMLLTVLPREPEVSWESHLCGALAGVLAALLWRKLDPPPPRKKYSWELEEELAALQAERDELELPRPDAVPVLWQRVAASEERGTVIPFRRPAPDAAMPDPESPTRH